MGAGGQGGDIRGGSAGHNQKETIKLACVLMSINITMLMEVISKLLLLLMVVNKVKLVKKIKELRMQKKLQIMLQRTGDPTIRGCTVE